MVSGERHIRDSWLRDFILGGQDGLVNVLGIVLGVTAASGERQIIIAASLAATFAEAVSMAAVVGFLFLSEGCLGRQCELDKTWLALSES